MVTCTLTQHLVHMTFREMSDELLFVLSPPRFGSSPQRKNLKISVRGPAEKALITAWEQVSY